MVSKQEMTLKDNPKWDAAIIGGGPAGSATAILLARQGKRVLLLEKTVAAHHKVCGEFLSHEAQSYLSVLGVDLHDLGAVKISRLRVTWGTQVAEATLPFQGMSVSRKRLDERLLMLAEANGVTVKRGHAVTGFSQEAGQWILTLGNQSHFVASNLYLASGKHEIPGLKARTGVHNEYIGFKLHLRLTPEQTAQLQDWVDVFLFSGGYGGLEPIEEGISNLCFVVRKTVYAAFGKDWTRLLGHLIDENPLLATRLSGSQPCWEKPLAIFGIPYGFVYRERPDGLNPFYHLGDQMAVIPSFCGEGISMALHSAFLALRYPNPSAYHQAARRAFHSQVRLASALLGLSTLPGAHRMLLLLFRVFPALLSHLAFQTRIRSLQVIEPELPGSLNPPYV